MLDNIIEFFIYLWTFELFNSGSVVVRVNQLVIALGIVVFGVLFSKWLLARLESKLLSHHFDRNTAYVLKRLLNYVLVAFSILIALPVAGIPITIFTVMGGALAIGVGFGAQNLFNNLISGLIIMTEKPIRIGDIVELSGYQGRVEAIGNRCVRIRRTDGVDLLVPNSYFLQEPVINWTHSDGEIRGSVGVGVAYGSPTSLVKDLIIQAAEKNPQILHQKELMVLFEDFGDSALVFKVLFWARVTRPMDIRRIQSDLRFSIDNLFRKHEISIAFPQMDIHLNSSKPIAIDLKGDQG